jgi:hypothetical protein
MRTCNGSRAARRFGRLVLLTASLTACTKWQVQAVSPQQLLAEGQPAQVRVTRADQTAIILRHPKLVGDTLYGSARNGAGQTEPRPGASLSDVAQVAIRRQDPLSTGFLALGSAALGAGVGVLIWASSMPAD